MFDIIKQEFNDNYFKLKLGKDAYFEWEYFENGYFESKTISKKLNVIYGFLPQDFWELELGTMWI